VKLGQGSIMTKKQNQMVCRNKDSDVFPVDVRKTRISSTSVRYKKQRGMTLLVGLILLVMLMMISIIGFRNTTLSERMTGNAVDRNVSFQSAESAGKEALSAIEASGIVPLTGAGYYATPLSNGGNTNYWTQGAGAVSSTCAADAVFSWTSCATAVTTKYANNSQNAQYVIEMLSQVATVTGPIITVSNYRVTSRSTGGSGNAEVVLQSIYSKSVTTP